MREVASSDRDWSFHSARKVLAAATLSGKCQTADSADSTDTSWPQSREHESRTPYYRSRETRSSASRLKSSEVLPMAIGFPTLGAERDRISSMSQIGGTRGLGTGRGIFGPNLLRGDWRHKRRIASRRSCFGYSPTAKRFSPRRPATTLHLRHPRPLLAC